MRTSIDAKGVLGLTVACGRISGQRAQRVAAGPAGPHQQDLRRQRLRGRLLRAGGRLQGLHDLRLGLGLRQFSRRLLRVGWQ